MPRRQDAESGPWREYMPRRASDRYPNEKRPCSFCRTLRVVIMFAVLMVALLAYSDNLTWLENIQFIDIFAASIGVAFVAVLAFKIWEEYGTPKQDRANQKEERREAMEKLFDEMDEAVAKREAEEASVHYVDPDTGDELVAHVEKRTEHEEHVTEDGATVTVDHSTVTMEVHVEERVEEAADSPGSDLRSAPHIEEAEIIEEVLDGEEAENEQEAGLESEDELRSGTEQSSGPKKQPQQLDIFGFELERK